MNICRHGVDSREATCGNCANTKRRKRSLRFRKFIAPLIDFLVPFFGLPTWVGCRSCGMPEHIVPFHAVMYNEGIGSSIICEACWRDISETEKLRLYKQAWVQAWQHCQSWEEIEKAIIYPLYWRNKTGGFMRIEMVE